MAETRGLGRGGTCAPCLRMEGEWGANEDLV